MIARTALPERRRREALARAPARAARRHVVLAAAAAVLAGSLTAGVAHAFKWHGCPEPPVPLNRSKIGATQSPFVHPGHELRIVLNQSQVAASGGFSLAAGGNLVDVTFHSLFGEPIALPARAVTAASAAVLSFDFPDAAVETGRALAGPAEVRVRAGDRLVAWIASADLVALPASNEVTSLLLGEDGSQIVQAALSARGDVWLPVRFLGEPGMDMPGCQGNFVMKAPITVAGAETRGVLSNGVDPLKRVKRIQGYLGDMVINGTSFYGLHWPERIRPVHVAGTLGVSICRMNDASDLVLRMRGSRAWARSRRSPLRGALADSSPLVLRLRASALAPARRNAKGEVFDAFDNVCETQPAPAADKGRAP